MCNISNSITNFNFKRHLMSTYKFVIKDIQGITRYKSIANCKTVAQAQTLGLSHFRLNDYPKGYYVDVV